LGGQEETCMTVPTVLLGPKYIRNIKKEGNVLLLNCLICDIRARCSGSTESATEH
jgi:hypothetical protein